MEEKETTNTKETRVAVISIIVEQPEAVGKLNAVLHDYADHIIGRMGIPYHKKQISVISVAMDAPVDRINALTGTLGRIEGISAKAVCAKI